MVETRAKTAIQEPSVSEQKQEKPVPEGYMKLTEGQADILYIQEKMEVDKDNKIVGGKKRQADEVNQTRGAVFYNPVQEFNRDTSIFCINEFNDLVSEERALKGKEHDGITVLEALAATGLRSVRYIKEIPSIKTLVANDILPAATDLMKKNFEFNDCPQEKIDVHTADAIDLMHGMRAKKKLFNVVDLDPYGTAIPFLESAISCIANNGMLCVTFTDMAVLCARQPHVCFYKMGASPLGKSYCHEMALRIVLFTINSMANKHGKQVEPMLSLTVDFYVRLFMRVKEAPAQCHKSIGRYSHVHQCTQCESFYLQKMGHAFTETVHVNEKGNIRKRERKFGSKFQHSAEEIAADPKLAEQDIEEGLKPKPDFPGAKDTIKTRNKFQLGRSDQVPKECGVCGSHMQVGGPIWNEKIHNISFVKRLLAKVKDIKAGKSHMKFKTIGRIEGILGGILDEDAVGNQPLSFDFPTVQSQCRMTTMTKKELTAGFRSLNYNVAQTYYNSSLWKTDAPPEVVYDLFKKYKKEKYPDLYLKNCDEKSIAYKILSTPMLDNDVNFDPEIVKQGEHKAKLLRRYFIAPTPNWGPKPRASGKQKEEDKEINKEESK